MACLEQKYTLMNTLETGNIDHQDIRTLLTARKKLRTAPLLQKNGATLISTPKPANLSKNNSQKSSKISTARSMKWKGYNINHMDLAPNFAGTLMGIANCVATLAGVLAPFQAGYVINQQPSLANWRTVFLTAAGLFAVGNTVFCVFGSTNQQPWNDPLPEPCLLVENDEELRRKARQYSVL